jgi:hypothetical protein
MGDAVGNDFDREAFHITDGFAAGFAAAYHTRNLQSFSDPAPSSSGSKSMVRFTSSLCCAAPLYTDSSNSASGVGSTS